MSAAIRRYRRSPDWDYSRGASLFVTIATEPRRPLFDRAVDQGYVVLSGFVSPGEKALRDQLCQRPDARFVRILPSAIPNARFRPESRYVPAFADGRYLEIARGNDEVAFGRAACLDYNAEIVEIASAGDGLALYWRDGGVERLDRQTRP